MCIKSVNPHSSESRCRALLRAPHADLTRMLMGRGISKQRLQGIVRPPDEKTVRNNTTNESSQRHERRSIMSRSLTQQPDELNSLNVLMSLMYGKNGSKTEKFQQVSTKTALWRERCKISIELITNNLHERRHNIQSTWRRTAESHLCYQVKSTIECRKKVQDLK